MASSCRKKYTASIGNKYSHDMTFCASGDLSGIFSANYPRLVSLFEHDDDGDEAGVDD